MSGMLYIKLIFENFFNENQQKKGIDHFSQNINDLILGLLLRSK